MSRHTKTKERRIFGYHLALDCYECDPKALDSVEVCYKYLDELPELIGVNKQSPPFVIYTDPVKYPDKAGISGWVPIVESGLSIHTITPTLFASIDIYSCKKYDIEFVKEYTRKIFHPKKIEEKFFTRGEEYIHPDPDSFS
ncbi:MAG: S-adenosylmethionine decarboxylase [bacterium]|nr:S-adenosylmethionine decarboxylase [bacterium]